MLMRSNASILIIDLLNLLSSPKVRCILDWIIFKDSLDTTRLSGSESSVHALISTSKSGELTFSNRILISLLVWDHLTFVLRMNLFAWMVLLLFVGLTL